MLSKSKTATKKSDKDDKGHKREADKREKRRRRRTNKGKRRRKDNENRRRERKLDAARGSNLSKQKRMAITIGPSRITQLIPQEFSGVTEVEYITLINFLRIFWRKRLCTFSKQGQDRVV